jgi:hypothetical protein
MGTDGGRSGMFVLIVVKLGGWSVMVCFPSLPSCEDELMGRWIPFSINRTVSFTSDAVMKLRYSTITLTLLPSLSSRHNTSSSIPSSPATYATDETPSPLQARLPNPAFLTRLAQSLVEEFDYVLHWDLPISTLVEFNEVGMSPSLSLFEIS